MKPTKPIKQEHIEDISDQLNKRSVSQSFEIEQLREADKQNEALISMNESLGVSNEQLKLAEINFKKSLKEISDYKYALDESSIIAITDQAGIIKQVNDNFCKISKYNEEELIGRDHRIISSGYHPKEFIRSLWITIANGKIWRGELKNRAKDGTYYWVDTTIVPFLNEAGKPYQYMAVRADVTRRKEAEQDVIKAYKEKEMVLNRISDAVVSVDNNWCYTFLNDAALATHPLGREQTLGKVIWEVHPEMKETVFWDKYHEAMSTGKVVEIEDHFAPMDIWFSVKVYPSSDGLTIFYRNVTERKKAEQQLSLLNTALEGRASELATSNHELERFAYVASHDLQEPLRMVSGFLQLLENKYNHQLDETAKKYINFAVEGAARMRILILDLLEFSRITTAKKDHTIINLDELVHKTLHILQTRLDESQASVTVANFPVVFGDESQLMQLFQNLISNALKYRRDLKPMIELGFAEKNDAWEFFVKDNGMGIDAINFDKIFDIFQRLHSQSEYPGTGIGLAICKKIVELHQGKIWVESSKEKGSTFYFTIPKFNNQY